MAFVDWATELSKYKDFLSNTDPTISSYTTADGRTVERHDLDAIQAHLSFLENKASAESNTSGAASRISQARPRGNF